MNLTDLAVKRLPAPEKGQRDYFDDGLHGFSVRVSQGGTKTFVLLHGTPRRRTTIGRYGVITLADARAEARRLLAEETLTKHRPTRLKAADALQAFLGSHVAINNRPSTQQSTTRRLNTHLLPVIRGKFLEDIAPADITKIIDAIMAKGTHGEANHAYVAMRTFFNWCVKRHYLTVSPCKGGMPSERPPRERTLHPSELKAIYLACANDPFGVNVKLFILTGQRRGEIAHVSVADGIATIDAAHTKNKRTHTFPLSPLACSLLAYDRSFNGWSKSKARLDKACGVSGWTLHDLRRTYATIHAELGTPPHIIERLINHATGTISGVAAIYNRFQYQPEMAAAVAAFDRWFRALLDDPCI